MTRNRKLHVLVSIVAFAGLAVGIRHGIDAGPGAVTADREPAAARVPLRRGLVGAVERARLDAPRLAPRPLEVRADAWLDANPPSPELAAALQAIAARAEQVKRELPAIADDDASAEALAAARRERAEQQERFRLELRSALRAMTPAQRASMRAQNVHVIQLARQLAKRTRG